MEANILLYSSWAKEPRLDLRERMGSDVIMDVELHVVNGWDIWVSLKKRLGLFFVCVYEEKGSYGCLLVRKSDCGRDCKLSIHFSNISLSQDLCICCFPDLGDLPWIS